MTATAMFVGIDIAKADFVVACRPDGTSWTATNDPERLAVTVGGAHPPRDYPPCPLARAPHRGY